MDLKNKIEAALAQCRLYLQIDGGDVELDRIEPDGIVYISYSGTCKNCPLSMMTLRGGIERTILKFAPEIKRVELKT